MENNNGGNERVSRIALRYCKILVGITSCFCVWMMLNTPSTLSLFCGAFFIFFAVFFIPFGRTQGGKLF